MKHGARWIQILFTVLCCLIPAAARAQLNNSNTNAIPTLDGVGLATLAGGLALAGSWVAARRRNKK